MTTNVANTATDRRFIFVILSVLKVFCFALRSSERVVLRVVLCSAGAECFFAPQEQRFFAAAGAECFLAPQEQNVYSCVCSNAALRRSAMWRSLLGPQPLTLQRVDASDRW